MSGCRSIRLQHITDKKPGLCSTVLFCMAVWLLRMLLLLLLPPKTAYSEMILARKLLRSLHMCIWSTFGDDVRSVCCCFLSHKTPFLIGLHSWIASPLQWLMITNLWGLEIACTGFCTIVHCKIAGTPVDSWAFLKLLKSRHFEKKVSEPHSYLS